MSENESPVTIAEVLAEHQKKTGVRDMMVHCWCGWAGDRSDKAFIEHQAAALSAAGFGPVRTDDQRLMLAATLAYDAIEDSALHQARAEGWDACAGRASRPGPQDNPYREASNAARSTVLDEVAAERERQDSKWGEQNHPNGTGDNQEFIRPAEYVHPAGEHILATMGTFAYRMKHRTDERAQRGTVTFADILLEEVFEALAEEDPAKLRTELIQVAAVAAQWVEAIDRTAS